MDEIKSDFKEYLKANLLSVKDSFSPLAIKIANESFEIIKGNINQFLNEQRTRDDLRAHVSRLKTEYLEKEIKPIFREEIWPVVQEETLIKIDPILREVVDQFPVSSVGWLYVYQSMPGTDDDHVERRIKEFFEKDGLEILEKHEEKLGEIPLAIAARLKDNDKIKQVADAALNKLLSDAQFSSWFKASIILLYERIKPELERRLEEQWGPEIQRVVARAIHQFEPYAVHMANRILLNLNVEGGDKPISPELAEVIRKQILRKDRYYLATAPVAPRGEADLLITKFNGKEGQR